MVDTGLSALGFRGQTSQRITLHYIIISFVMGIARIGKCVGCTQCAGTEKVYYGACFYHIILSYHQGIWSRNVALLATGVRCCHVGKLCVFLVYTNDL